MESAIQNIVDTIIKSKNDGFTGNLKTVAGVIRVPDRHVGLSELRRLKRQFLQMNNFYTQSDVEKVTCSFVEYINLNF